MPNEGPNQLTEKLDIENFAGNELLTDNFEVITDNSAQLVDSAAQAASDHGQKSVAWVAMSPGTIETSRIAIDALTAFHQPLKELFHRYFSPSNSLNSSDGMTLENFVKLCQDYRLFSPTSAALSQQPARLKQLNIATAEQVFATCLGDLQNEGKVNFTEFYQCLVRLASETIVEVAEYGATLASLTKRDKIFLFLSEVLKMTPQNSNYPSRIPARKTKSPQPPVHGRFSGPQLVSSAASAVPRSDSPSFAQNVIQSTKPKFSQPRPSNYSQLANYSPGQSSSQPHQPDSKESIVPPVFAQLPAVKKANSSSSSASREEDFIIKKKPNSIIVKPKPIASQNPKPVRPIFNVITVRNSI
jgi:hypothetical protein